MAVVVNTIVLVDFMNVELAFLDEVVVADHHSGKRAHQARIARQKGEQASGILDDIPQCADNAE
jgi:hypothetical protein